MIRVKAYKLKEGIYRLLINIAFVVCFYFSLALLIHILHIREKTFAFEMVEENIISYHSEDTSDLNISLVKKELFLTNKITRKEIPKYEVAENNSFHLDMTEEMPPLLDSSITNQEDQFISSENMMLQTRPTHFDVKELSSSKIQVGKVTITNHSKLNLNLEELGKVSQYSVSQGSKVLIYHTHTSEAYSEIGVSNNFRTTNDSYNVVAVGEVLKENLLMKNFYVLHNMTKHDTPSYNGAYGASLNTVEKLLKQNHFDIIIDLHRDALSGNVNFRPTAQINGETVSKLMFVIGTNGSGLSHDHWMNNLQFALLIQNRAEEMYPGLFRDLNLSSNRYNQHLSEGAMIIEVGATGNTLGETKLAMKYLANVLASFFPVGDGSNRALSKHKLIYYVKLKPDWNRPQSGVYKFFNYFYKLCRQKEENVLKWKLS